MIQVFKKAYPYYGKIYGILFICVLFGLVQGGVALLEPQIITLMVDRVINPVLGKEAEYGSSIFNFVIEGYAPDDYWGMLMVLSTLFIGFMEEKIF